MLYFFHKLLKLDILVKDKSGSTPLHWACFSCSELALIYLLAWLKPSDLQIQDNNGYTALHLSVGSSEQLKNCRPTRALLYRGAVKDIKDNEGKKPIDKAREIEDSPSIRSELVRYLEHDRGYFDCLMLKTPLRKMDKSWLMPIIFLALNLSSYACLALFIFPIYESKWLMYLNVGLESVMFIFWVVAAAMNPGYIVKPPSVDFLKLLQLIDPVQICPDCMIVRTPRSRHCGACNHCVERFDHHCPWINNCVGTRNHWAFLIFLVTMEFSIILNFGLTIENIIRIDTDEKL